MIVIERTGGLFTDCYVEDDGQQHPLPAMGFVVTSKADDPGDVLISFHPSFVRVIDVEEEPHVARVPEGA